LLGKISKSPVKEPADADILEFSVAAGQELFKCVNLRTPEEVDLSVCGGQITQEEMSRKGVRPFFADIFVKAALKRPLLRRLNQLGYR
jgi:hypothetical protein